MHPYVKSIQTHLQKHADPVAAGSMKRYMRDQFEYLGIKIPRLGELLKEYYGRHGLPDVAELDVIARDLWSLPQREFQYTATGMIGRFEKELVSSQRLGVGKRIGLAEHEFVSGFCN